MKSIQYFFLFVLISSFIACNKKPSCSDGLQNQNEIRTDCGGPCAACPGCSDGIMNQDETGIDCGGVCNKCLTCSDGIKNQGETGIDCGGPCNTCPIVYPNQGTQGPNILRNDTLTIKGSLSASQSGAMYCLRAEIPDGKSLKIKMINKSSTLWYYTPSMATGWKFNAYDYNNNSQEFNGVANSNIPNDVPIFFVGNGSAVIEFYENNSITPTKTKSITWNL